MESLIIPKGFDTFVMHVPPGSEHWPRRNEMTETFESKGLILWADEGDCLPERPLWQPFPDDLLTDKELDALICAVGAKIVARGETAIANAPP